MEKEGPCCSKRQKQRKVILIHSLSIYVCATGSILNTNSGLTRRSRFGYYFRMHQHQFSMPRYQDLSTNPLHQPPKKIFSKELSPNCEGPGLVPGSQAETPGRDALVPFSNRC